MKKANKNMVKLAEVRNEMKAQKGSVSQIIKGVYSYKGEETPKLNKILPANPKDLCAIAARLCKELKVGEVKVDKNGKAKTNAKGEELTYKFTQAALVSWLVKNQKNLKAIMQEEAEKKAAPATTTKDEKAHAVAAATIEKACAKIQAEKKGLKNLFGKKSA